MPNHVDNKVYMRNIGTYKELFTETPDGDMNLDFSKIIPMPDDLDVDSPMSDASLDLAMSMLIRRLAMMPRYRYSGIYRDYLLQLAQLKPELPEWAKGKEDELTMMGIDYMRNIIKHGYPTWYEWCVANWGTKWSSYWGKIIDNNTIQFTTAWDIPYNINLVLSEQYPNDEIIVDWFNEGGCFGRTSFLDGDMIEEKVYTFTGDWEEEQNRLFQKVELIEERGKF